MNEKKTSKFSYLKEIDLKNQTVFQQAELHFTPGLNVIIGENGTGKSHLLKLAYSILAVSADEGRKPNVGMPTKVLLQSRLADKLINVFRPETLGNLIRHGRNRKRCEVFARFDNQKLDIHFSFSSQSRTEVVLKLVPSIWLDKSPVFLPTRELLTLYPNFVAVYENHYLEFEEIYRDTCILLGALPIKGGQKRGQKLLTPLEKAVGGRLYLDNNGRFYLVMPNLDKIEMPLVAEGARKLGMLIQLISTGALLDNGYLFWDEPEANLNPRLLKLTAEVIFRLCQNGIQVFIATHSLFLLRELEILRQKAEYKRLPSQFFALEKQEEGVIIEQGEGIEEINPIRVLDEMIEQSDRYMDME